MVMVMTTVKVLVSVCVLVCCSFHTSTGFVVGPTPTSHDRSQIVFRRHRGVGSGSAGGVVTAVSVTTSTSTSLSVTTPAATTATSSSSSEVDPTNTMTLFSPCKINLFLRIIRRREDGFHDLASLFQAIGFGDTLELSLLSDEQAAESAAAIATPNDESLDYADSFSCNMPGVPVDSSNLVLRALELMRTKTGQKQYFAANLIKQVPAQAGLGGGSANAATAMWGANELMGRPASLKEVSFNLLMLSLRLILTTILLTQPQSLSRFYTNYRVLYILHNICCTKQKDD
jgi:hypothetical protein